MYNFNFQFMRKKNITLDDLARMVADGFAVAASKEDVAKLDKRLTNLEDRVHEQE